MGKTLVRKVAGGGSAKSTPPLSRGSSRPARAQGRFGNAGTASLLMQREMVRPKLEPGSVSDAPEHEAGATADKVMRMQAGGDCTSGDGGGVTVRRSSEAGAAGATTIRRQIAPATGSPVQSGPPSFLAALVDVAGMTNAELLSEAMRVDDWLRAHGAGDHPDQLEYWRLARKLRAERRIRVTAGHVWLAAVGGALPGRLYGLQTAAGFHNILEMDLQAVLGARGSPGMLILTEAQFLTVCEANSVSLVDVSDKPPAEQVTTVTTYATAAGLGPGAVTPVPTPPGQDDGAAGRQGSQATSVGIALGGAVNPKDVSMAKAFSTPLEHGWSQWTGKMGEASYQGSAGSGFGAVTPLNQQGWTDFRTGIEHPAAQQNYPVMDFQRTGTGLAPKILGVVRISSKTSLSAPLQRQAFYRKGMGDMLSGNAVDQYLSNQPEMAGLVQGTPAYEAAKRKILSNAVLAVNDDDVPLLKQSLSDATGKWKFPGYRRIYNAELSLSPITIQTAGGPLTFSSIADIDAAAGVPQKTLDEVKLELGRRAQQRVQGSGSATAELRALKASKQAIAPNIPVNNVPSQFIAQEKQGGGLAGSVKAMQISAGQGAKTGSLIGLITQFGMIVYDENEHPDWASEVLEVASMSAATGAVGGGLQQGLTAQGTKYALSGKSPEFLTPELVTSGSRMLTSGFLGGGMELISIGMEDREHSAGEILTRTGRTTTMSMVAGEVGVAAGTGAVAVIFGSAGAGAAAGSAVPIAGTIVGFVVGLVVGAATYYLLDETVPGGRDDWDPNSTGKGNLPLAKPGQDWRTAVDNTYVAPRSAPLSAAVLNQLQQDLNAEEGMRTRGTPFAAGVDDDAIPAGYGLRASEQLEALGE